MNTYENLTDTELATCLRNPMTYDSENLIKEALARILLKQNETDYGDCHNIISG